MNNQILKLIGTQMDKNETVCDLSQISLNEKILKFIQDHLKKLEKDRIVMKRKIASAFPNDIDKNLFTEELQSNPNDIFDEEESIKFLSGEIGIELTKDDKDAYELIHLVGFQRLALQMIGSMFAPANKKKAAMSWEEIKKLIVSIRLELGLSSSIPI